MQRQKWFAYLMIANLLMLVAIAIIQRNNQQLAYDVGGIYTGTLIGIVFGLFVHAVPDILGLPIGEVIQTLLHRQNKWIRIRGSRVEFIAVIGMGLLLAVMTRIGDYKFFGHDFAGNHTGAIVLMGAVGAIYGLMLLAEELWFDYWIWQGNYLTYAIALLEKLFLLSLVIAFSEYFLGTFFFAVGIISRSITRMILYKYDYNPDKEFHRVGYVAICLILLVPLIYRLPS